MVSEPASAGAAPREVPRAVPREVPRFVIAAAASGAGKTTVTIGLMAALRDRGLVVAPGKVGPDFIDPGYHELACDRPGRNLDPFLVGEARIAPLLLHGALTPTPADVVVIEGVMGLYDGRLGHTVSAGSRGAGSGGSGGSGAGGLAGFGSTAHVAMLTASPVVLCIDARHTSRTVGAVVHGLATYEPGVRIAGVILNQVGSTRHAAEAISAIEAIGVPVLGTLPRDPDLVAPSRHLGLVPAAERAESRAQLARLAAHVGDHVDLDAVLAVARTAPPLAASPWDPAAELGASPAPVGGGVRPRVAVAGGRAFTFRYAETAELLSAAGCEVVTFDPLTDEALPEGTAGLYLGGGFPQVHAGELTAKTRLREDLRRRIAEGLPTVAECAGLLYLCETLDGAPMVGALAATAAMTPRLTLGYREAISPGDTLLTRAGERVTGHEFHRTATTWAAPDAAVCADDAPVAEGPSPDEPPAAPTPSVAPATPAWTWGVGHAEGVSADPTGAGRPSVHASYLHVHWAGHPQLARRFADAVHAFAADRATGTPSPAADAAPLRSPDPLPLDVAEPGGPAAGANEESPADEVDLHHHGDRDIAPGLVNFAVNVRPLRTPEFLVHEILRETDFSAYPDATGIPEIVAAHHGVPADHVLLTSGAAEAFTLIARALRPERPLVVHPQFTEPEAALLAAGHAPARHVLDRRDNFALDPAAVDARADLVMIGNPTNPTSVLHPRAAIEALRASGPPGRVLVVDEAFMDATPGEAQAMIPPVVLRRLDATTSDNPAYDARGLLVLRSLTKTWGIAGLRAGYVLGDPALIAALAAQQPPWSVSTPALRAVAACLTPRAVELAQREADRIAADRADLLTQLAGIGLEPGRDVIAPAAAPFVLIDTARLLSGTPPTLPTTGSATLLSGIPTDMSVVARLAAHGVAVRRGETFPGLGPTWIRVAVRSPELHARLVVALAALTTDPADHREARP